MTTLITAEACLAHEMAPGHPERPARLRATTDHLRACGLMDDLDVIEAEPATTAAIERVHDPDYVDHDADLRSDLGDPLEQVYTSLDAQLGRILEALEAKDAETLKTLLAANIRGGFSVIERTYNRMVTRRTIRFEECCPSIIIFLSQ